MSTNAGARPEDAPPATTRPGIPFPTKKVTRAVAREELAILEALYPEPKTALDWTTPYTLLLAVVLSAQCTDARVNQTTPALFAAYPTPVDLATASLVDVEEVVKPLGFFRMKAKSIVGAAQALVERHGGEVPRDRESLEALPGVGRKTASVVMSVAFESAAFAVDTHVFRVAKRLGLTLGTTPRAVEDDVVKLVPEEKLRHAHHWLILHGRQICKAPTPLCGRCVVHDLCPTAPLVAKALAKRGSAAKRPSAKRSRGMTRPAETLITTDHRRGSEAAVFKVRIRERGLPSGRVSITAAQAILKALQVGLRVEASTMSARNAIGRRSRLADDSTAMSLIAITDGSGVMELASDGLSLVDLPARAFESFVDEANRHDGDETTGNAGIRRAILSLGSLFGENSRVETIDFVDGRGRVASITADTIARMRDLLTASTPADLENSLRVVGRMLELDLGLRRFQVHTLHGPVVIHYEDHLESIVFDALRSFVAAEFTLTALGTRSLISLHPFEAISASRFDAPSTLRTMIEEQGVSPVMDPERLAMASLGGSEAVPLDVFREFVRSLGDRH